MKRLSEMDTDSAVLAAGLRENGERHLSYKLYTSIERALAFIVTGELYLLNGSRWNDINDRGLMEKNNAYGICLSCSTSENIAMWMLYSGEHGKRGAMLDFPRSVMKEILKSETIELGAFNDRGIFKAGEVLKKEEGNFDIFLTDVLYTDECKNGKVKITLRDDHDTVEKTVLDGKDIFHKDFGWSYEKECRLTVRLSDSKMAVALDQEWGVVRITLLSKARRTMSEDRLFRAPIFAGGVSVGKESKLTGGIEWNFT